MNDDQMIKQFDKLYAYMDTRFGAIDRRFNIVESELAKKADADDMNRQLAEVRTQVAEVTTKVAQVTAQVAEVKETIGGIAQEVLDGIADERIAHDKQVEEHQSRQDNWIRQLAHTTGTKLTPEL